MNLACAAIFLIDPGTGTQSGRGSEEDVMRESRIWEIPRS